MTRLFLILFFLPFFNFAQLPCMLVDTLEIGSHTYEYTYPRARGLWFQAKSSFNWRSALSSIKTAGIQYSAHPAADMGGIRGGRSDARLPRRAQRMQSHHCLNLDFACAPPIKSETVWNIFCRSTLWLDLDQRLLAREQCTTEINVTFFQACKFRTPYIISKHVAKIM